MDKRSLNKRISSRMPADKLLSFIDEVESKAEYEDEDTGYT